MKLHLVLPCICVSSAFAFDPDIILDAHSNPANVTFSPPGAWTDEIAPNLTNAFRGNSKVASNASASTYATFKTRLPKAGPYSVFVWHNGGTSYFAYNSTVQVTQADATPTSVSLSESGNAGQWLLLGTYWFEGNDDGSNTCKEAEIKIMGYGNMKLSADAVRFMRATPDMVLDSDSGGTAVAFTPNTTAWPTVSDKSGNAGGIRRALSTASGTVAYTFTVPVRGDYDVSLWLPGSNGAWAGGSAATSFSVEIQHPTAAGQNPPASTVVSVNLPSVGTNEGQWVRIVNPATANDDAPRAGTFRFLATATNVVNKVTIKTAGASGAGAGPWQVPADAVRLSKVGDWTAYMDEDDSSFPPVPGVAGTTNWTTNTAVQPARGWADWNKAQFGPAYKWFNFSSSAQGPASMTYSPLIPELGLYDIYLWYPVASYSTSSNNPGTKVTVQYGNGTTASALNQQTGTGGWRFAGRFTLRPSDHATYPPKLTIATPSNPYNQQTQNYQWSSWWYLNQGYVLSDGVMFLRDNEGVDSDGDGVMDWLETLEGTNPNSGSTNDYNYLAGIYYPGVAPMSATVTAPGGAVIY